MDQASIMGYLSFNSKAWQGQNRGGVATFMVELSGQRVLNYPYPKDINRKETIETMREIL